MEEFDKGAYQNKVALDYSSLGKPTDNTFNGSFRDECLNMHWFLSLDNAYEKINAWVHEYNYFRPYSSLNDQTPVEAVEQCKSTEEPNSKTNSLPAASLHEATYFAATEHASTTSKNTYLHEEILTPTNSPISPT